jgi:ribose transport system substrate-binding protein
MKTSRMKHAAVWLSLFATAATSAIVVGGPAGASSSSNLASAQAQMKKYEETPKTIPQTVPLKSPVNTSQTFVYLECDNTQCHDIGDGTIAAAKAIGWKIQVIDYQSANPATLVTAFQQALSYHPVAVAETGTGAAEWASVLPAYKAAGVPIIASSSGPITLEAPISAVVDAAPAYTVPASIIADWFITSSKGKGQALIVNVPSFPVLNETANSIASTIKKECSGCKSTQLSASLTELGNGGLIPAIVAGLKRNPGIKYVISSDGDFIDGLAPAIASAGLSGVKIGSTIGGIVNEQDIIAGKESATLPWPGGIEGWVIIDAAARLSEKMPVPNGDSNQPIQLLVKANVGTPTESLMKPTNYEHLYEKLWKVSS